MRLSAHRARVLPRALRHRADVVTRRARDVAPVDRASRAATEPRHDRADSDPEARRDGRDHRPQAGRASRHGARSPSQRSGQDDHGPVSRRHHGDELGGEASARRANGAVAGQRDVVDPRHLRRLGGAALCDDVDRLDGVSRLPQPRGRGVGAARADGAKRTDAGRPEGRVRWREDPRRAGGEPGCQGRRCVRDRTG